MLALAYAGRGTRTSVDVVVISHFDGHGVAFAAARLRVLRQGGETAEAVSKFPETGPRGLSDGSLLQLVQGYAPHRYEVVDIPLDVRNPEASIATLRKLSETAPVYYYDHHETDIPFVQRLHAAGIYAAVFGDNASMAAALGLLSEPAARELAIVGIVADRDPSVLKFASREEVEKKYLPLANKLDIIVRQPSLVNATTQGEVAKMLAEYGVAMLEQVSVEYPPERLARELSNRIVEQGSIAILVDLSELDPRLSQWVPKTLEQMLLDTGRYIAVAVAPGYNPRTRTLEGYDVRVLRYWLAPSDVPVPEEVARELIAQKAITGNVVGHADYVSIRYPSKEQAMIAARMIYRRVEGSLSTAAHLVNDQIVAQAVRRDFHAILERLTELLEQQKRMYEEYLELKRKQVELLERTQRHEYD